MKIKLFLFIIYASIIFISSCDNKPHPKQAVEFNDQIVFKQDTFYLHIDAILQHIKNNPNSDLIYPLIDQAKKYTITTIDFFNNLEPFDNEDEIRLAAIKFFSTQLNMLNNEFDQIAEIHSQPIDSITLSDEEKWDSLMINIEKIDSITINDFLKSQDIFAKKYGITLIEID